MLNLFQNELSESDLATMLEQAPVGSVLSPLGSESWRLAAEHPAAQTWMPPLAELAAQELEHEMPALSDAMYRDFHATGGRADFEQAYYERRRQLSRAAICALMENEDARQPWLVSLLRKIGGLLTEYSWALPAHLDAPSGKDPMFLDLCVAETAALLAETLDLFREVLPAQTADAICERLRREVFENYAQRSEDFWWTHTGGHWNAVCHSGILRSALQVEEDVTLVARMMAQARRYLAVYLESFRNDGACPEGPGYWQHGFGALAMLNEVLETRSGGALSLFEDDPRIAEIARYGPRVTLANRHFVNFSDSPREGVLNPALLTYLGLRLDDELLLAHGYRNYAEMMSVGLNLHAQRCDLPYLTRLILNCPREHSAERTVESEDTIFPDAGILIARGRDLSGHLWEFAAKAGHNAENHNHNDAGSFLLHIDGEPMIMEIGAPEFTPGYLKQHRYEYLAARSLGHSVPLVNGREQAAGPQYSARVLVQNITEEQADFSVDLAPCYPAGAHCDDLVRTFELHKKTGLLRVRELFELGLSESYETALITTCRVELRGNGARLHGEKRVLQVTPFEDTLLDRVDTHEYRDQGGISQVVFRIVLKPAKLPEQQLVGYELTVAR